MTDTADENLIEDDKNDADPDVNVEKQSSEQKHENIELQVDDPRLVADKTDHIFSSEDDLPLDKIISATKEETNEADQTDLKHPKNEIATSENENDLILGNDTPKGSDVMDNEDITLNRNGSFEIQECVLGQEILNELFYSHVSTDYNIKYESKEDLDYIHKQRSSINEESSSSYEIILDRVDIISKLKDALAELKGLSDDNHFYQSKLVEYFKLMKAKQKAGSKTIAEKDVVIDFNTQYERYREIFKVLVDDLEYDANKYRDKIERLRSASEIKTLQNEDSYKDFIKFQETVGLLTVHSRTGFKLDPNIIKDFFQTEGKKEAFIKLERLSNLKLEHKNLRFDKALRSKENFQSGLRLIDFEQLKIENQTFNEKVEERREAINKLNRKIANCNNLLSHIKEKINFTDHVKRTSKQKLNLLNKDFKRAQKYNNRNKRVRDYIKTNNRNLQMSCGLLGKQDYLKKFEESMDDVERRKNTIMKIENHIQDITKSSCGLANKINPKNKNVK